MGNAGSMRTADCRRHSGSTTIICLWPALACLIGLSVAAPALSQERSAAPPAFQPPPETRREEFADTLHSVLIPDPYRWLEDQESPETRAWIDAQNAYARSFLDSLPVRQRVKTRLEELVRVDRIAIPTARNGRYFFAMRKADQDLYVIYMREGVKGKDEVLIDPHAMSADKSVSVDMYDVSRDGKLLCYGVREGGQDEERIRLFDVEARADLADSLPKAVYLGVSLMPDKSGVYYSRYGPEGARVYYHAMGTDPAADVQVFGEGYGPDKGIGVGVSEDGRYLVAVVWHGSAGQKTEVHLQDLVVKGPFKVVVDDVDARFSPQMGGDKMFMVTDWNSPNGRVLCVDLKDPARESWKEIVPESKATIEGMSLAGGRLFVNYLDNVVSKVKVFEVDGKFVRDIALPSLGSVSGMAGQWSSDEAFYLFTSFHVPTTIYRYEIEKGNQEVWAELNVPVDTDKLEVKQVWYTSKDGTKVPMFLVYKKGVELDGDNPTVLTGYGGFNTSMTPYFSSMQVTWAEMGGVTAVPNLRGGGEFGEEWHRAGMFEKKQNVFDDFIAAAEWLIANNYTNSSRLAISGGSNGGLLVGAAMVQRPDLFEAVVCTYPLLDMLRYHKFLMGQFWVSEYGSADDPEQFGYIRAYSPYHNVKKGVEYPATLFITGDSDTRVAPLHARKMAALLQAESGSQEPVLLLYDTKLGHSGGRPISKLIEDVADEMSFACWQLGVE
ncbi:MAG: S9 family peptidase [Candidatus Eisenbacteria bacterium]|nr:S9 family peptidase [Candidatus Eisenbacteria bacterium]